MSVGKKVSISASTVGKTESSIKRLSTLVRGTFSGRRQSLDENWESGSTYVVAGDKLRIWPDMQMTGGHIARLSKHDEFTLLQVHDGPQVAIGYILPRASAGPEADTPGWTLLEDRRSEEPPLVLKRRVEQRSWTLKGRYEVRHEVTARETVDFGSPVVGDIPAGEEVLVLDIGVNSTMGGHFPRLRMKVASDRGFVGWITAITTQDNVMLDTLNLLGPHMVQVRKSFRERGGRASIVPSFVGRTKSYESSHVRGCRGTGRSWIPSGDYRVLQATELKEEPHGVSESIAELLPGMVVTVINLGACKEEGRPMAYVNASSSGDLKGWVFLVSMKGFDIIDTRDLSEFDKVQAWLRQSMDGDRQDTEDHAGAKEREAVGGGERGEQERGCAEGSGSGDGDEDEKEGEEKEEDDESRSEDTNCGEGTDTASAENVHISLDVEEDASEAAAAGPPAPAKRGRASFQDNVLASLIGQPCMAGCFKPMAAATHAPALRA